MPVTIELGVLAIVIGLVLALPVGVYSAIRQDTAADYLGRTVAVMGLATPNFWLATMVLLYPALWWGWSPPIDLIPFEEDPLGNLGIFIIPRVILGTALAASTMRMTRTMMLEVLRQDYIRTAWSKGLPGADSYHKTRHQECPHPGGDAHRPAAPHPDRGSVILEQIFALPGIGRLFVVALDARDYPIVSAINLILLQRFWVQSHHRPDLLLLGPQDSV